MVRFVNFRILVLKYQICITVFVSIIMLKSTNSISFRDKPGDRDKSTI